MLPPFIIEQIRRREEDERRREAEQPRLELPLDYPARPAPARRQEDDEERDRGVIILDLGLGVALPLHRAGAAPAETARRPRCSESGLGGSACTSLPSRSRAPPQRGRSTGQRRRDNARRQEGPMNPVDLLARQTRVRADAFFVALVVPGAGGGDCRRNAPRVGRVLPDGPRPHTARAADVFPDRRRGLAGRAGAVRRQQRLRPPVQGGHRPGPRSRAHPRRRATPVGRRRG